LLPHVYSVIAGNHRRLKRKANGARLKPDWMKLKSGQIMNAEIQREPPCDGGSVK